MSNASQALIMAAGILLGVLILALIVTLFANASSLADRYDKAKQLEAVEKYNSVFTQYLSRDLTIHEITTIRHLAEDKKIEIDDKCDGGLSDNINKYTTSIKNPVAEDGSDNNVQKYRLTVEFNTATGYINKIIIDEK